MTCQARQYSDQMLCRCGLAWDVNDLEPPECRKIFHRPTMRVPSGSIYSIRDNIDAFLDACRCAGVRVRQIKIGILEATMLSRMAPTEYRRGHYRGIPLRLSTLSRWTKDTQ